MAKHVTRSYQQEYEMTLHHIYEQEYKMKLRYKRCLILVSALLLFLITSIITYSAAEQRIKQKMLQNQDLQSFYYVPSSTRYQKYARDLNEEDPLRGGSS